MVLASVICTIPFQLTYFTKEFGAPFLIKETKNNNMIYVRNSAGIGINYTRGHRASKERVLWVWELASGEIASCVYSARTTFVHKLWKIIAK